ncbi:MAG: type II toxin-antitoxin system VapC family toxin [Macromonas sp.]
MNVLVDTSVWVGHFKQRNHQLVALLETGLVICHPYVVLEVACGTPPNRHTAVKLLQELEHAPVATGQEVMALLDNRQLYGRGCGFVDMHLLTSALLGERTQLWTLDKRLATLADELGLLYRPTLQ